MQLVRRQVDDLGAEGRVGCLREREVDDAFVVGKAQRLEEEQYVHFRLDSYHSFVRPELSNLGVKF